MIRWMEEILHQLIDSRHPIISNYICLEFLPYWCRISQPSTLVWTKHIETLKIMGYAYHLSTIFLPFPLMSQLQMAHLCRGQLCCGGEIKAVGWHAFEGEGESHPCLIYRNVSNHSNPPHRHTHTHIYIYICAV